VAGAGAAAVGALTTQLAADAEALDAFLDGATARRIVPLAVAS
jgi:hypothetical protein